MNAGAQKVFDMPWIVNMKHALNSAINCIIARMIHTGNVYCFLTYKTECFNIVSVRQYALIVICAKTYIFKYNLELNFMRN